MSEKRVNIKITASTSDFEKAIKNAQNKIEKLAKTIEDLGSGKFGNQLEKQLEAVADSADKMQKSLKEMQDTLDDVNKSKMDKLEDGLDDATDATKDLNKELEDTAKTLDDLSDTKIDKLEEQFEEAKKATETFEEKLDDVINSLNDIDDIDIDNAKKSFENMRESSQELGKRIDDLLDNFDKLDSQDLNRLQDEFEQIKTSVRDLGTDFKNAVEDLDKEIDDAANEIGLFDKAIDEIEVDKFIKLEESIMDLDKYIDEAYQSMQDFSRESNNVETDKINEYVSAVEKLDNINSKINIDTGSNKSNKNSSDRISDVVTELAGAELISNRVTSAIQDLDKSIDRVADSMKDMNQPVQETVKNYQDMVDNLIKAQNAMDDAEKEQEQLTDALNKNNKTIEAYEQKISSTEKTLEFWANTQKKLEEHNTRLTKSVKEYESALSDAEKDIESYTKALEEMQEAGKKIDDSFDINSLEKMDDMLREITERVDLLDDSLTKKGTNYFSELAKDLRDLSPVLADAADELHKLFNGKGNFNSEDDWFDEVIKQMREFTKIAREEFKDIPDALDVIRVGFREVRDELKEYKTAWEDQGTIEAIIIDQAEATEKLSKAQERLNQLQSDSSVKKYQDDLEQLAKMEERIARAAEQRGKYMKENQWDINALESYKNEIKALAEESEKLEDQMKELQGTIDKSNNIANQAADEFEKQYKAYERLSQSVKDYLQNEKNAIVLREKVARSFREVSDAMEKVFADSSKHNNLDLINKTLEEAAEHFKDLNLVSTENLQADLKRLGEIVEDKTEKIKRFKEVNKEFGSDASKAAYGIEKQGEALKEYADSTGYVIEATNTLKKAWGDISVGDIDHLKIRPRIELLEDYERKLRQAVTEIQESYSKMQGPLTAEQQDKLNDWKIWEKNAEKLKQYNKALEEYFTTIMDSGGNIDTKFLDELGKFDISKFVKEFEKMGSTSVVLQKQFNAVKIELQEWLQTEKEFRQEAVKSAEAALEQAKANKKNAESQEELAEATKKVEKAQEDLNRARESLKNFTTDASNEVKKLNEMAEALRKIGMAAEDLGKEDIAQFDRSLASLLDRLKTFDNDLPKTFADLREDIKAVFMDMDSLDFSGVFDGLKDIGAGLLSQLPTDLKIAAAAAWALEEALRACAKAGIEQLSEGIETVKGALSGLVGIARDVGQEIRDAFENITGMPMDFSSLMEIPVEFESQMAKVGAIAGATGEEFEKLEAKARELGATTRYSATEVAEAMEYMGMAGWTTQEIIDGLAGVLDLATVSGMDLGKASDFVTDGLTAFGMKADEAGKMVDWLATASTKSNTSVAQMQSAFSNCASVADSFEVDMQDLIIALGLMANQGVKGAKAGTAMKNLITNLNTLTEAQAKCVEEYNLQAAREAIINGDLLGGLKLLKTALEDLDTPTKNAVIETLVGKEALNGVSALLGTTTEDMKELEDAMGNCTGAASEMAKNFDDTLKGALKGLASAMQEQLLQIFDKVEGNIKDVTKQFTEFFNILNGLSTGGNGSGLADALAYLEKASQGWGKAIAKNLEEAIGAIDDFINSKSFDNLLQIGTNLINGIADGIKKAADNGTLDSAISTIIRKIATWFSENLDTIVDAGKEIIDAISKGISENHAEIGKAVRAVIEMQTEIDKAVAKEKWKLIGDNLVTFIIEGIESKIEVFIAALSGFFSTGVTEALGKVADWLGNGASTVVFDPVKALGTSIGEWLRDAILGAFNIDFDLGDFFSGFSFGKKDKKKDTNKKDTSNKDNKNTGSSSGWDSFKKELESWGKSISDWGADVKKKASDAWDDICASFSKGEEKTSTAVSDSKVSIEKELDNWGESINNWGKDVSNWFSDAWDSVCDSFSNWGKEASKSWDNTLEELSEWKTGITNWGTEVGEEFSKVGDNIKTFFTETLPGYFDPEKLGTALGTFTGNIARELVDGWKAIDEWGNDLYEKGSEAAIKYSDGIRDFFIELPDKISDWVSDAWTAVDTWGNELYEKGSEAAIKYSDGIRDFLVELPGNVANWLTETSESIIQWSVDLYNEGKEAAENFILGIGEGFVSLCDKVSTWLSDTWAAVDSYGTELYTKGSESVTNYSNGVRDFFVELPDKISDWLSEAWKAVDTWGNDLYEKGSEAAIKYSDGIRDFFVQLPGKISTWLTETSEAIIKWGVDLYNEGKEAAENFILGIGEGFNSLVNRVTEWCTTFKNSFMSAFKKAFGIHSPSTVMRDEIGTNLVLGIVEGLTNGIGTITEAISGIVESVKTSFSSFWDNIFGGKDKNQDLLNIDISKINETKLAIESLATSVQSAQNQIRDALVSIANVFRNQFVNMANIARNQMLNVSNIIRNQAMTWSNIISNQVTNARNAFTQQMMSMAAVARTQMVNVSNVIRNQALNWANIVNNQAKNARDNFTRQMMSMVSVAKTQMAKVLSTIKTYMNQIAASTKKTMTMNFKVNKTVTTKNITASASGAALSANALYAANAASTYSLMGNNASTLSSRASSVASGSNNSSPGTRGAEEAQVIHTHVYLEGKEIARAAAKYMDGEIKTLNKREDRKRGVK